MPVLLFTFYLPGHLTVSILGDVMAYFPPFRRKCFLLFILQQNEKQLPQTCLRPEVDNPTQ